MNNYSESKEALDIYNNLLERIREIVEEAEYELKRSRRK